MTPTERYWPHLPPPPIEWPIQDDSLCLWRDRGGLGDLLMLRMLFADVKRQSGKRLVVALPSRYHDAVRDHPDVDEVRPDCTTYRIDYGEWYDVSEVCGYYESRMAPQVNLHRSDIWAARTGYRIDDHDMRLRVGPEDRAYADRLLHDLPTGRPIVAVCPITSTRGRDLTRAQLDSIYDALHRDYSLVVLHDEPVDWYDVPTLTGMTIRDLFGVAACCDAAICAETSHSHLFGGLGKPVVACYSQGDGDVYGRYYARWRTIQHRSGFRRRPDMAKVPGARIVEAFHSLGV